MSERDRDGTFVDSALAPRTVSHNVSRPPVTPHASSRSSRSAHATPYFRSAPVAHTRHGSDEGTAIDRRRAASCEGRARDKRPIADTPANDQRKRMRARSTARLDARYTPLTLGPPSPSSRTSTKMPTPISVAVCSERAVQTVDELISGEFSSTHYSRLD